MALTQFTTDISYIAALPDSPTPNGGFSKAQLKAEFDKAGNALKTFINETMIAEIETELNAKASSTNFYNKNDLNSTVDGSSGADKIGVTSIDGLTGTTAQAVLESVGASFAEITNTISSVELIKVYGAKLDGITDDSTAFQNALNAGNIVLNKKYTIVLNNTINVPSNRILDFNGSIINTSASVLFLFGDFNTVNYSGFGTIKNIGNIVTGDIQNNIIFKCQRTIAQQFINIKKSQIKDTETIWEMTNTFNIKLDDCYIGYYNAQTVSNAYIYKILSITDPMLPNGTDNNTNSIIQNSLFQNSAYGVHIDSGSPATATLDTLTLFNVGFSKNVTCFKSIGNKTKDHVNAIKNCRFETSTTAIDNDIALTLSDVYFVNDQNSIKNNVNGQITCNGQIKVINSGSLTTPTAITNTGVLYLDSARVSFDATQQFTLGVHTRPWNPSIYVLGSTDFSTVIEKVANTIIRTTVNWNFSDLPIINVANGTELKIYSWVTSKPQLPNGLYYEGFGRGMIHVQFLDGAWKIVGGYATSTTP